MFSLFFNSAILSFLVCYLLFWATIFLTSGRINPIDTPILYTIVNLVMTFYVYFFWIPAAIVTVIYQVSSL